MEQGITLAIRQQTEMIGQIEYWFRNKLILSGNAVRYAFLRNVSDRSLNFLCHTNVLQRLIHVIQSIFPEPKCFLVGSTFKQDNVALFVARSPYTLSDTTPKYVLFIL